MATVGAWLRQTREANGATLEQAEETTRIRVRYLKMLESGDFAAFPGGQPQIRGFLRLYARFLGLSDAEVLRRYDTEVHGVAEALSEDGLPPTGTLNAPATRVRPAGGRINAILSQVRLAEASSLQRLLLVAVAIALTVAILSLVGYYALNLFPGQPSEAVPPTLSSPSTVTPSSDTPVALDISSPVTTTLQLNANGTVSVTLAAKEHVWVRVSAGESKPFQGMMSPSQVKSWDTTDVVLVETGNGAALEISVNGQALGLMCGRGEACARAWSPAGELDPEVLAATAAAVPSGG
jgi:cytoskeleton protein RodZ